MSAKSFNGTPWRMETLPRQPALYSYNHDWEDSLRWWTLQCRHRIDTQRDTRYKPDTAVQTTAISRLQNEMPCDTRNVSQRMWINLETWYGCGLGPYTVLMKNPIAYYTRQVCWNSSGLASPERLFPSLVHEGQGTGLVLTRFHDQPISNPHLQPSQEGYRLQLHWYGKRWMGRSSCDLRERWDGVAQQSINQRKLPISRGNVFWKRRRTIRAGKHTVGTASHRGRRKHKTKVTSREYANHSKLSRQQHTLFGNETTIRLLSKDIFSSLTMPQRSIVLPLQDGPWSIVAGYAGSYAISWTRSFEDPATQFLQ